MESNTLWRIINKHFEDNPHYLVAHHLESYNDFFHKDIFEIFKNQNPIQITSAFDDKIGDFKHKCNLYIGGRTGRRIYFGKPMIHDTNTSTGWNAQNTYEQIELNRSDVISLDKGLNSPWRLINL